MELFGFEIKRARPPEANLSFAPPENDDGAVTVAAGGAYGTYVDLDGTVRTEAELISKYRDMSMHPEVDEAIDNIVNEVIVFEENQPLVDIVLDDINIGDNVKDIITQEFKQTLDLLEFNDIAWDIFKRWYIDGRLYYHAIINEAAPEEGVLEYRYIDPRKLRKIREVRKVRDRQNPQVNYVQVVNEYYVYNERGFVANMKNQAQAGIPTSTTGIRIAKDAIVNVSSGLTSSSGDMILSYLHQAIKPLNQLRALEDASVIYRLTRAPERRVFYIDVGNLPKIKAEQYVRDIMTKFKNKLVYDASTGAVKDDRKFMTMLEDFWLPRREGGRGTEITTLPGGANLGQMDDVLYFQKRLYSALNVPISRLQPETLYTLGRATEISRDEVKFARFIDRLRSKFSQLFIRTLEKQLTLKGILSGDEWDLIKNHIKFKFAKDNYFEELKQSEIIRNRFDIAAQLDPLVGKYVSRTWIRKNVLKQTDEEMQMLDSEMEFELEQDMMKMQEQQQMQMQLQGGDPNQQEQQPPPN